MRLKVKSKDDIIDELQDENMKLVKDYCNLQVQKFELESKIKDFRKELLEERERYADLLERYIKTMERTARIDEQR